MVLLLVAAMAAFTVTGAHIVDYGIYDTIRVGEQESPKTTQGTVHVLHERLDPVLRKQTTRVEGRVGVHFGFRFQFDGTPHLAEVPLTVRVRHPEFTNPATGKKSTVEEWDAAANLDLARFTGWAFDQPYEIVPGAWTIQILREGQVVLQKEFVVLSP